jgi:hypothetical protein
MSCLERGRPPRPSARASSACSPGSPPPANILEDHITYITMRIRILIAGSGSANKSKCFRGSNGDVEARNEGVDAQYGAL